MRRESKLMATSANKLNPVDRLTDEAREEVSHGSGHYAGAVAADSFTSALRLFEEGRVTTAQAAAMCGMPSVDFLLAAERSNVPRPGARSYQVQP